MNFFKPVDMRNALVQLSLVLIGVTSVHAVKLLQTSSFHARIFPAEGVEKVWAIQGSDSIQMIGSEGDYYLNTPRPGHWQVLIEAKKPYKDVNFWVYDMRPGTDKDMGEIRLEK